MSSATFWRILYLTTLVGLVVALGKSRAETRAVVQSWEDQREQLTRIRSIDELTGRRIGLLPVSDLAGETHDLRTIGVRRPTWVLDPASCASCLDQVTTWNTAAVTQPEAPVLVLVGVSPERATVMRNELGIRLDTYTAEADFREKAGFRMPSTYLYLGEQGLILLADAHSTHTSCEWDFPVQVANIAAGGFVEGKSLSNLPNP